MEDHFLKMFVQRAFGEADYQVWMADSPGHWLMASGSSPVDAHIDDDSPYKFDWPSLANSGNHCYAARYEPKANSQLFVLETEPPESCAVRALIRSGRPLARTECDHFVLHVRYLLLRQTSERQWQEHEQWLQGLRSLTTSLDLNELLLNIMHNALTAIPAVDRGFLMLYDPHTRKLVPKASVGMGPSIYDFKVEVGEGITGKVFDAGIGKIYDMEQSIEAMNNIKAENRESLMAASQSTNADNRQAVTMAVPVGMKNERIGVMIVHQIRKNRKLGKQDLRRLQGFADQAAIAISNASLYTELRETNRYLVRRNEIHDVFTKLSLNNDDLETVLQTVEKIIELPAALFDFTKNEWYPHNKPAAHALKDMDLFPFFDGHAKAVTVTGSSGGLFYLYPIVNGVVLLGFFAVELRRPLRQLDIVVLEQGGTVVALEMVNTYSVTEMYYKRSYEFFNELLQYREPMVIASKSKEFGLSPSVPLFVAVLQLAEETQDLKKKEARLRRLIAGLQKELGQSDNLLFGFHDKVTIIMHAANGSKQNGLIQKLKSAAGKWENGGTPLLHGGIGGLYKGLENVLKSSEEANKSLAFMLRRSKPGITRYEEIGINRLFLNQQPEEIEQYIEEVLAPLRTHKALASGLEQTLKAYMAANRSASVTAERLHIHPNTLYHRLRKIEEALDADLNDPDDWLKIYLACHLSENN